ncbi:hypothetical protein [Deinococcus sp. QL22]|uniref:hypothetical protein n=1 Tax=Deinococcus sp. QL22 TaxID=2939437 RepID=UPI00201792BD|nr:hypothetical protein [Deinococcus sp. QL22]UQN07974.1 hypothetical protein M1R55_17910 [Deinococcus sp. QL22]
MVSEICGQNLYQSMVDSDWEAADAEHLSEALQNFLSSYLSLVSQIQNQQSSSVLFGLKLEILPLGQINMELQYDSLPAELKELN